MSVCLSVCLYVCMYANLTNLYIYIHILRADLACNAFTINKYIYKYNIYEIQLHGYTWMIYDGRNINRRQLGCPDHIRLHLNFRHLLKHRWQALGYHWCKQSEKKKKKQQQEGLTNIKATILLFIIILKYNYRMCIYI